MSLKAKVGVLLVNLGTPLSYDPRDVYRYLIEFLTDKRVLDYGWIKRQLLVRGIIVPFRYKQSAKLYQEIWTEKGSPLLIHSLKDREELQKSLGDHFKVVLAMRYQFPSIEQGLEELRQSKVEKIVIFPLFPQYSSATTGSIHEKVMKLIKDWDVIPNLSFINSFPDNSDFIEAIYQRTLEHKFSDFDHILFSFHGLPERQIIKNEGSCLQGTCCNQINEKNKFCYKAQCFATSAALAEKLNLSKSQYTVCFQSRLGKEPWIQPYASDILKKCAEENKKKLLVLSPSFVCDCLETLSEIAHEYKRDFIKLGGNDLQLVESLNSHPSWIKAMHSTIISSL